VGWMIGFIAPYTFTRRNYRQYSSIADLRTFQFTVIHELGFSFFTNRILGIGLLQSHYHFIRHMKSSFHRLIPSLPLLCNCQFRRFDSIQFLCSQVYILAGRRIVTRLTSLLLYAAGHFFITTLHGPHRKHRLQLSRIVLDVLTAPLHNNSRGADRVLENNLSVVEQYLPRARVYRVIA
jgi:hypothetical protein